jgi:hypothetical protein
MGWDFPKDRELQEMFAATTEELRCLGSPRLPLTTLESTLISPGAGS